MPEVPASRGYSGGFSAALMAKDLRIAMQLAAATQQPLFMGEKAALLYRQVGRCLGVVLGCLGAKCCNEAGILWLRG